MTGNQALKWLKQNLLYIYVNVLPNTNQTILTLPDGQQIMPDSAADGKIVNEDSILAIKIQSAASSLRYPEFFAGDTVTATLCTFQ